MSTPPPTTAKPGHRLQAIDALRGLIMFFMMVDHIREIVYAHHAVTDPMNALTLEPSLFFTRITSQFCAPIFVALTGVGAYLYSQSHTKSETSMFLLKRGLFLIVLEFTLVSGAWAAQHFPPTFWLQVIWAIGLCMIVLSALIHLPRVWQITLAAVLVVGHNLLDPIVLTPDSPFYIPWSVLHQRALYHLAGGIDLKISYPVLPWIGVILLGFAIGPWFARTNDPAKRMKNLLMLGTSFIVAFIVIRFANIYGEKPWVHTGDALRTVMSFLSATKYPPSLMFLLPTLGTGLIMLSVLERIQDSKMVPTLAALGSAPMFFYLLHLYVLKLLYYICVSIWGLNHGTNFGFDHVWQIWLAAFILIVPLYIPSRWFSGFKQRRRDIWWLSYL